MVERLINWPFLIIGCVIVQSNSFGVFFDICKKNTHYEQVLNETFLGDIY